MKFEINVEISQMLEHEQRYNCFKCNRKINYADYFNFVNKNLVFCLNCAEWRIKLEIEDILNKFKQKKNIKTVLKKTKYEIMKDNEI